MKGNLFAATPLMNRVVDASVQTGFYTKPKFGASPFLMPHIKPKATFTPPHCEQK